MSDPPPRTTVILNVTPSLRTRSCTTEVSEALGRQLLEAATEYQERIPEGLYLKLCDLAKVQHNCVRPEDMHDAKAAIHSLMMELSNQYRLVEMLKDTAMKRDEFIVALQESKTTLEGALDLERKKQDLEARLGEAKRKRQRK